MNPYNPRDRTRSRVALIDVTESSPQDDHRPVRFPERWTDGDLVSDVYRREDGLEVCVIVPTDSRGNPDDTEWIAAIEGAFVPLTSLR